MPVVLYFRPVYYDGTKYNISIDTAATSFPDTSVQEENNPKIKSVQEENNPKIKLDVVLISILLVLGSLILILVICPAKRRKQQTYRRIKDNDEEHSLENAKTNFKYGQTAAQWFTDVITSRINNLSKTTELKTKLPCTTEEVEPGTIFLLYVTVIWEKDKLVVLEQTNDCQRKKFFDARLSKATRVIWIKSESVRAIEAKLRVYKEYEEHLNQNILLHHDADTDEDICNMRKFQILCSISENILSTMENISKDVPEDILKTAIDKVLTLHKIKELCCNVQLTDNDYHDGKVGNRGSNYHSVSTIKRYKKCLVEKTLLESADALALQICRELINNIEVKVELELRDEFRSLQNEVSREIFPAFDFSFQLVDITLFVKTIFFSIDINARNWRNDVAEEIFTILHKYNNLLYKVLLPTVAVMCSKTTKIFRSVSENINEMRRTINLPDLEKSKKEWEKRRVIKNREILKTKYPSVRTYIAGEKNGESVLKVFLRSDDTKAKQFILENAPLNMVVQFVNIANEKRGNSDRKLKNKTPLINKDTRDSLREIIKKRSRELMAKHSTIVAIRIGCMMLEEGQYGAPCIVLYCLDKTLVPFGEQTLPDTIEGYPVDIREACVMFGHCANCQSIDQGCSIGRPSTDSAGSVGFLAISNRDPSMIYFLTAAHAALSRFEDLYNTNVLLSKHSQFNDVHEIVHPSYQENNTNNIIGRVLEAFCGNFGPNKIGVDVALVSIYKPDYTAINKLPMVDNADLTSDPFDGTTQVRKYGSTTGQTTGSLVDDSLSVCVDHDFRDGGFYLFEDCYGIEDNGSPFFQPGDSGSGVFVLDQQDTIFKALGIAFASCGSLTAVCNITDILAVFDVSIFQEHETMELD